MTRLYLIIPAILVALFGGFYWQHSRTVAAEAEQRAAIVAAAKEAELTKKAEAEALARADAAQRAAARLADEQRAEAEKTARFEEEGRRIAADTATYQAQVAELKTQAAAQESQLANLRARRAALNDETYILARSVETARIEKRNAEFEVTRLTEMVARQATNTTLAR
jgi:chromosome segregation ATPase